MNHKKENELNIIQKELKNKIHLENRVQLDEMNLIAGVDVAYWSKDAIDYGVCCIVVLDYTTKEIIEQVEYAGRIEFPYIPGYLAFRELPIILETVKKLKVEPDVYMFDGNGYLHNRHMGIATHASFDLDKPTIGIAKTYFKIKNIDYILPENKIGAYTDIILGNETYGRTLRTREAVQPIFVSCGNWIDLDTATRLTMHFVEKDSRLPITTRYADLATHEARKRCKTWLS